MGGQTGLQPALQAGGGGSAASYDSARSDRIKTKALGCEFNRPRTQREALDALHASRGEFGSLFQGDNVSRCVHFVRADGRSLATDMSGTPPFSLNLMPFGVEVVDLAIHEDADLPRAITLAQMHRVYRCFDFTIANEPVVLRMLEPSPTWTTWISATVAGISEAEIANGDYSRLAWDHDDNPEQLRWGHLAT